MENTFGQYSHSVSDPTRSLSLLYSISKQYKSISDFRFLPVNLHNGYDRRVFGENLFLFHPSRWDSGCVHRPFVHPLPLRRYGTKRLDLIFYSCCRSSQIHRIPDHLIHLKKQEVPLCLRSLRQTVGRDVLWIPAHRFYYTIWNPILLQFNRERISLTDADSHPALLCPTHYKMYLALQTPPHHKNIRKANRLPYVFISAKKLPDIINTQMHHSPARLQHREVI